MSYSGWSPLCSGRSRAIPPLAGLNVEKSALIAEEKGFAAVPTACDAEKRHWSDQVLITTRQAERKNRVNT